MKLSSPTFFFGNNWLPKDPFWRNDQIPTFPTLLTSRISCSISKDGMLTKILVLSLVSVLVLVNPLKYLFNKTFWSLFAIFTLSWTGLEHSFKIKTFEIEQKPIWVKIDLLVDHRHGASLHFSQVKSEWMRQKLTGIINLKWTRPCLESLRVGLENLFGILGWRCPF